MRDQVDVAPQSRPAPLSLPFGAALPTTVSHARQGPGSLLAIASGSIAGDLRGIALDEKRRIATYELLVANETISPVATFAYVVGANPGGLMSWSTITVPAFSSIAVAIDVPLPPRGKEQRVVVELHAEDAHLTLDAKAPQPNGPRFKSPSLPVLGGITAIFFGTTLYNVTKPRVSVLEAPSSVIAGKPFVVAYAINGNASGTYLIETPDGFQVRRGDLDRAHNALILDLPEFPIARGYDMRVTAQGVLGTQTRTTHITAIPPPPPPLMAPARVSRQNGLPVISLTSDTVASGGQIALTYPISGGTGSATLYDQNNVPRGTTLLDKNGHALLLAPVVSADQSLRVVVRAQSGNSTVESSAALTIKAQSVSTAPPEVAGSFKEDAGVPFTTPTRSVKSGEIIRIPILRHEDTLRIGFSAADGRALYQVDVALSQSDVHLRAPVVTSPTPYLIVGTYRRGVGQETVVRRIMVTP
jgi:hypothetical protein